MLRNRLPLISLATWGGSSSNAASFRTFERSVSLNKMKNFRPSMGLVFCFFF